MRIVSPPRGELSRLRTPLTEGKEVTDQIIVAAAATLECIEPVTGRIVQRAWRLAIEAWLAENRVITLSQSQRTVTHFSEENVSLSLR